MPQQRLLEITRGAVFHDPRGELAAVRDALAWYPDEMWLWLLACQWRRIDQEEAFVGRAAEVGDELGCRVLTARLVRDAMRLGFLLERRYAPYGKWLGTAFAQLKSVDTLHTALLDVLAAADQTARQDALVAAMEDLAARHNELGMTRPVDPTVRLFHSRPFRVLGSARFVDACLEHVTDPWLRSLPLVGAIDRSPTRPMCSASSASSAPTRLCSTAGLPCPSASPRPSGAQQARVRAAGSEPDARRPAESLRSPVSRPRA